MGLCPQKVVVGTDADFVKDLKARRDCARCQW